MSWLLLTLACGLQAPPSPEPPSAPEPTAEAAAPEPEPLPDPTEAQLAATHVLIAFAGALGAGPQVTRSEDEARELAAELHRRAGAGESVEDLARAHSDDPSGRRGGGLGVWRTGLMHRDFERCTAAAGVGQLGPLCRTPFGFHVIRRDPVLEVMARSLVLPLPAGATEEQLAEATARAARLGSVLAGGTLEDDGATISELGAVSAGQLVPALDAALFELQPGETSAPIRVGDTLVVLHRLR